MTEGVDPGGSGRRAGTGGVREVAPATDRRGRSAGIALVAVVFAFLLPKIADYADVWDVVTSLSGPAIAALAVATVINVATYGPPWMAALPGLNYRQSMVLTQTSTALSVAVPGGDAVGIAASYAMLRGWNFDRQAVAVAVVVTSVWNQIVNVVLPVLALSLLLLSGGSSPLLLTAGLIGIGAIVLLAVALALVLRG